MKKHIHSYKPLAIAVLFSSVMWLIVTILSQNSAFTTHVYPKFYAWFYPKFTMIWARVPFSVGDVLYIITGLILLFGVIMIFRCLVLGQQWRSLRVLARFIQFFGFIYLVFHILWGFNYYAPNLSDDLQGNNYTEEELKFIAEDVFKQTIDLRENLQEDEKGVFFFKRKMFYEHQPDHIKLKNIDLKYHQIPRKSLKKYSIFSYFMRYFGVGGYYNPFTAEAQVTRLSPTTNLPNNMAHEQAHQMGYATEYEANFIGYLTSLQSSDQSIQYAAQFKALKYILNDLYSRDSVYVRESLENFSPGMKRDYEAEIAFHQKYSGRANQLFSKMNNVYLKANRQTEGIQSYNRFVELLVGYYRTEKNMNLVENE